MDGGWVENTGVMPVDGDVLVDVLFGGESADYDGKKAKFWTWGLNGIYPITHWRLHEDESVTNPNLSIKFSNPKDAIGDTKVPLWLLSTVAKAEWALAQFAGMCKYAAWNWRKAGVRNSVYLSAMQRHMDAYKEGEEYDPVDNTHHLGNIMACCAIILDAKAAGKLTDDRPPSVKFRYTYSRVQDTMVTLKEKYKDVKLTHFTIADTENPND